MICSDAAFNIMSIYGCLAYYKRVRFIGHFFWNDRISLCDSPLGLAGEERMARILIKLSAFIIILMTNKKGNSIWILFYH